MDINSEVQIQIEEVEPTTEMVELQAAKQLLMELKMVKNRIYTSGTLVNSVLIVQIKQILRGLISKYNSCGLFEGENITLRLSDRSTSASINFVYSPKLHLLMQQVVKTLVQPVNPLVAAIPPVEVPNA